MKNKPYIKIRISDHKDPSSYKIQNSNESYMYLNLDNNIKTLAKFFIKVAEDIVKNIKNYDIIIKNSINTGNIDTNSFLNTFTILANINIKNIYKNIYLQKFNKVLKLLQFK